MSFLKFTSYTDADCNTDRLIELKVFKDKNERQNSHQTLDKINDQGTKQSRVLLISTLNVYNIKSISSLDSVQRVVELKNIQQITSNMNNNEFLIHIENDYDYHFESDQKEKIIQNLRACQFDQANGILRIVDVETKSLQIQRKTKKMIQMGITNIMPKGQESDEFEITKERATTIQAKSQEDPSKVEISDFKIHKVLGRGSFGKVLLVEQKDGHLFAMKCLKKDMIIERKNLERTKAEKDIMLFADHNCLVKLNFVFQTKDQVIFVMDQMYGGELFQHLRKNRRFSEEVVKFWAAQIADGLCQLHNQNIVQRDLKPENLLLDEKGNIKITDFGMSKQLDENRANSFVGTPEYLAPEIIQKNQQDQAVDWWAQGILIFELMVGIPPFQSESRQTMFERILSKKLAFPTKIPISVEMKDLISGCLMKNPGERLNKDNVKLSKVFEDIDWLKISNLEYEPKFIPQVSDPLKAENFDLDFTKQEPRLSVVDDKKMNKIESYKDDFRDFTNI